MPRIYVPIYQSKRPMLPGRDVRTLQTGFVWSPRLLPCYHDGVKGDHAPFLPVGQKS